MPRSFGGADLQIGMPAAQAESRTIMLFRHHGVRIATAVAGLGAVLVLGTPPHSSGQPPAPATDWQAFQKTVRPFLARHCFEGHTDKQRGGVRLDQFAEKAPAPRPPA